MSPGSLIASMPAHCLIFRKEEIGGSSNSYPRLHMREGGADRGSSASTALTEEPVPSSQPAPCSVFWEVPLFPYSYILLSEVGNRAASIFTDTAATTAQQPAQQQNSGTAKGQQSSRISPTTASSLGHALGHQHPLLFTTRGLLPTGLFRRLTNRGVCLTQHSVFSETYHQMLVTRYRRKCLRLSIIEPS